MAEIAPGNVVGVGAGVDVARSILMLEKKEEEMNSHA